MRNRIAKLREFLLESPACRTVLSAVIPIVTGFLSGALVVEITTPAGLNWHQIDKTWSFYGLCVLTLMTYWYNRALYLSQREVSRFSDEEYCIAYMRSKCLPEAADRYRDLIRSGNGGELSQAMAELRKILK